ncbi:hypothetical protein [Saccharothrix xinjiangensis]|uniref:Uncharacterized protein n=1 Tax=Saccharothrix xinjiangensis TaxID=204798 RepID=A0ABV9XUW2_9PSEU
MSNNAHQRDLIDDRTGDTFHQPAPFGLVTPVACADGTAPSSQRGRTWQDLTASGRVLRPAGGAR